MVCRRTGNKPLREPMMTQFNYAYMRHPTLMAFNPVYSKFVKELQIIHSATSLACVIFMCF